MKILSNLLMSVFVLAGCKHAGDLSDKRAVFDAGDTQVYTLFANRAEKTMSLVYANQTAVVSAAKGWAGTIKGEQLTVVTYQEEIDPFWYGSNINGHIKAVERLTLERPLDGASGWIYQLLQGRTPRSGHGQLISISSRIQEILSKRPVVFP